MASGEYRRQNYLRERAKERKTSHDFLISSCSCLPSRPNLIAKKSPPTLRPTESLMTIEISQISAANYERRRPATFSLSSPTKLFKSLLTFPFSPLRRTCKELFLQRAAARLLFTFYLRGRSRWEFSSLFLRKKSVKIAKLVSSRSSLYLFTCVVYFTRFAFHSAPSNLSFHEAISIESSPGLTKNRLCRHRTWKISERFARVLMRDENESR